MRYAKLNRRHESMTATTEWKWGWAGHTASTCTMQMPTEQQWMGDRRKMMRRNGMHLMVTNTAAPKCWKSLCTFVSEMCPTAYAVSSSSVDDLMPVSRIFFISLRPGFFSNNFHFLLEYFSFQRITVFGCCCWAKRADSFTAEGERRKKKDLMSGNWSTEQLLWKGITKEKHETLFENNKFRWTLKLTLVQVPHVYKSNV